VGGIDPAYGADVALLRRMLSSPQRTLRPEEADFFFVPLLVRVRVRVRVRVFRVRVFRVRVTLTLTLTLTLTSSRSASARTASASTCPRAAPRG